MPETLDLTARDALAWAHRSTAPRRWASRTRTGSLTPGKQADVIVVGGGRLNMTPRPTRSGRSSSRPTPPTCGTCSWPGASVKRDGELVGVDVARVRRLADESRERVYGNVLAHGPLLPEGTPEFDEQLNQLGVANIARAHELAGR